MATCSRNERQLQCLLDYKIPYNLPQVFGESRSRAHVSDVTRCKKQKQTKANKKEGRRLHRLYAQVLFFILLLFIVFFTFNFFKVLFLCKFSPPTATTRRHRENWWNGFSDVHCGQTEEMCEVYLSAGAKCRVAVVPCEHLRWHLQLAHADADDVALLLRYLYWHVYSALSDLFLHSFVTVFAVDL